MGKALIFPRLKYPLNPFPHHNFRLPAKRPHFCDVRHPVFYFPFPEPCFIAIAHNLYLGLAASHLFCELGKLKYGGWLGIPYVVRLSCHALFHDNKDAVGNILNISETAGLVSLAENSYHFIIGCSFQKNRHYPIVKLPGPVYIEKPYNPYVASEFLVECLCIYL